jgi:SAM-dependent methyltransferase
MEAIDKRRYAPATLRNRDAILGVLKPYLSSSGLVLEVASGSGEHALHFAQASAASLVFQPSDPDSGARASIDAWAASLRLPNVRPAVALDAAAEAWPVAHADAVICINMIHIAPWEAAVGLMRGAARVLPPEDVLYLYGPYRRGGRHTAPSNEAFDLSLRARNPSWGVRDLEAVVELAQNHGFAAPEVEEMPANNLSLFFRRQP